MQRTLKRELKVLEIVKREAFEAPIRSFFLKLQRTLGKIQLIRHRSNARSFLWPEERVFIDPRKRGQGGVRGGKGQLFSCFIFSCLALLVGCKRVFVFGEMGALFLLFSGEPASVFHHHMFHHILGREKLTG